jgi:hypothetical protein
MHFRVQFLYPGIFGSKGRRAEPAPDPFKAQVIERVIRKTSPVNIEPYFKSTPVPDRKNIEL